MDAIFHFLSLLRHSRFLCLSTAPALPAHSISSSVAVRSELQIRALPPTTSSLTSVWRLQGDSTVDNILQCVVPSSHSVGSCGHRTCSAVLDGVRKPHFGSAGVTRQDWQYVHVKQCEHGKVSRFDEIAACYLDLPNYFRGRVAL